MLQQEQHITISPQREIWCFAGLCGTGLLSQAVHTAQGRSMLTPQELYILDPVLSGPRIPRVWSWGLQVATRALAKTCHFGGFVFGGWPVAQYLPPSVSFKCLRATSMLLPLQRKVLPLAALRWESRAPVETCFSFVRAQVCQKLWFQHVAA